MATTRMRLSLRWTPGPDGRTVYDDVDPDRLSPAGRALFDALQRPFSSLDILLRSRKTRREMGAKAGGLLTEDDLDGTVCVTWRGWSQYPADSQTDIHDYLDQQAHRIDPSYMIDDSDYPARMTADQVLIYLNRHGRVIGPGTWRSYVARGQAPAAVDHVGRTPVWDLSQVEEWARCTTHARDARTGPTPAAAGEEGQ
jgi:hypothetical protein